MDSGTLSTVIIISGIALILIGIGLRIPGIGFGKLPGDIVVKRENFTFYMPITTMIIISLLISLLMIIIRIIQR